MQLQRCSNPECGEEYVAKTRRSRYCEKCYDKSRTLDRHKRRTPQFRALDGEGIGEDYVLLGIGNDQIEWPNGVDEIGEIFEFLYTDFLGHPDHYYGGFYLGYDWTNWLKLLPRNRIAYLIDPAFIARRSRQESPVPFPVRYDDWEFDWLYGKRFKLRPDSRYHTPGKWMYICDWGPFFQTSLLKVLEKRSEQSNITEEMMEIIREGKSKRATAQLDDDMRRYNALENFALEDSMRDIDHSLSVLGVPLGKTEYHGPGQAAQKWLLKQEHVKEANSAVMELPSEIYDAIVASFYAGIFEITTHGHCPGLSYEYDLNSAYPYQIKNLPCTCGPWIRSRNPVTSREPVLQLIHGRFYGKSDRLGPLPFRTAERGILRPRQGSGWYWDFEIAAAFRAGLLQRFEADEYVSYLGCKHGKILRGIEHLYDERLRVGKESAIGKGCKLIYNSVFGKTAQSVGNPQAANAVFASLIPAGCRTMILDAIATHPKGVKALLMIATDAVFFDSPHPGLTLSSKLGDWDLKERENLTLFKPGMYWDDKAREAIRVGKNPEFKSRGVHAGDFAKHIAAVDNQWREFKARKTAPWPSFKMPVGFAQVSLKQAYQRTAGIKDEQEQQEVYGELAGFVIQDNRTAEEIAAGVEPAKSITQSSDPKGKRNAAVVSRGVRITTPIYAGDPELESTPYDRRFGRPENELEEYSIEDTSLDMALAEALQLRG